jgi:hypothetical protein
VISAVAGGVVLPPGPASLAAVRDLLKITTTADDPLITNAVDAANAYVAELPTRLLVTLPELPDDPPVLSWPANTVLGANMLAGRLYRRRNSPAGVESFSDLGGAVYVQRNDPDIALLLRTGAYARPMVG